MPPRAPRAARGGQTGVLYCVVMRVGCWAGPRDGCAGATLSCTCARRFPEGLNLYCKQESCYDVLELEETATSAEIKKAYRRMSLKYHPDKSDADDAQAVFMRIATAYEVLSVDKMRKAYDDFLAHPERHVWEHYGHYYGAVYAPKSDLRLVIGGILAALSALQYTIFTTRRARLIEVILAQNKSQMYIKKRVVEMGGDKLNLKKEAQFAEWKQLEKAATQEVLSKAVVDGKRLSDTMGILDVLAMRIILLPLDLVKGAYFHVRWFLLFTLLKKPLGEQEQVYVTCRVIKCLEIEWREKDEEEQAELLGMELWLPENKLAWEEERRQEQEEQRREFVQVPFPPVPSPRTLLMSLPQSLPSLNPAPLR